MKECIKEGCSSKRYAYGLCTYHYGEKQAALAKWKQMNPGVRKTIKNFIREERGLPVSVMDPIVVKNKSKVFKKNLKLPNPSSAIKELEKALKTTLHSYIRARAANEFGRVKCVVCGVEKNWKGDDMHTGHFLESDNYPKSRYKEFNLHPQCKNCNYFGDTKDYRAWMVSEYGEEAVLAFELENKGTHTYSIEELGALIKKYKPLLAQELLKFE